MKVSCRDTVSTRSCCMSPSTANFVSLLFRLWLLYITAEQNRDRVVNKKKRGQKRSFRFVNRKKVKFSFRGARFLRLNKVLFYWEWQLADGAFRLGGRLIFGKTQTVSCGIKEERNGRIFIVRLLELVEINSKFLKARYQKSYKTPSRKHFSSRKLLLFVH